GRDAVPRPVLDDGQGRAGRQAGNDLTEILQPEMGGAFKHAIYVNGALDAEAHLQPTGGGEATALGVEGGVVERVAREQGELIARVISRRCGQSIREPDAPAGA